MRLASCLAFWLFTDLLRPFFFLDGFLLFCLPLFIFFPLVDFFPIASLPISWELFQPFSLILKAPILERRLFSPGSGSKYEICVRRGRTQSIRTDFRFTTKTEQNGAESKQSFDCWNVPDRRGVNPESCRHYNYDKLRDIVETSLSLCLINVCLFSITFLQDFHPTLHMVNMAF